MPMSSCCVVALCRTVSWLVQMTSLIGWELWERLNHDIHVYLRVNELACLSVFVRFYSFKGFKIEVNVSFNRDFSPLRPLLYLRWCHQWSGVTFQVYFRELIHTDLSETYWVTSLITALRGPLCVSAPPMSSMDHFCPPWPLSQCLGLLGQDD